MANGPFDTLFKTPFELSLEIVPDIVYSGNLPDPGVSPVSKSYSQKTVYRADIKIIGSKGKHWPSK